MIIHQTHPSRKPSCSLHPSETLGATLVAPSLHDHNYHNWIKLIRRALSSKNKIQFNNGSLTKPNQLTLIVNSLFPLPLPVFLTFSRTNHLPATLPPSLLAAALHLRLVWGPTVFFFSLLFFHASKILGFSSILFLQLDLLMPTCYSLLFLQLDYCFVSIFYCLLYSLIFCSGIFQFDWTKKQLNMLPKTYEQKSMNNKWFPFHIWVKKVNNKENLKIMIKSTTYTILQLHKNIWRNLQDR